jgi:hypothetical protein
MDSFPQEPHDEEAAKQANTGIILGLVGLIAWFIPLFGFPVTIVGLVKSLKGLNSSNKGVATAGLVLCIIGLVLTTGNAAIGAYLGATGQHPLLQRGNP